MATYYLGVTFDGGVGSALGGFVAANDDSARREAARQLRRALNQPGVLSAVNVSLTDSNGRRVLDLPVADFLKFEA